MTMKSSERAELSKLARLRFRLLRRNLVVQGDEQLAHVEQQLAAEYPEDDPRWEEITEAAREAVMKADAAVAKRCREIGIPESFRPRHAVWYDRGDNAFKERRAELRRVAQAKIEAAVGRAQIEVDRAEVALLTKLTAAGLCSEDGVKFLETDMPNIERLMPKLSLPELEQRSPLPPAPEPWILKS